MGGEHHVCFHNKSKSPCYYIHDDDDDEHNKYINSETDIKVWVSIVKPEIITFLQDFTIDTIDTYVNIIDDEDNKEIRVIERWIEKIKRYKNPSDIDLYWAAREDYDGIIGSLLHDVTKILMIAFPGNVCACFDRCKYYKEFESESWDMCEVPHGRYDIENPPNFLLFKPKNSKFFIKLLSKQYQFSFSLLEKYGLRIPGKLKLLLSLFPPEIVELIGSYSYIIYVKHSNLIYAKEYRHFDLYKNLILDEKH